MRPTLNQIYAAIRRHTGDTEVAGGQQFTDGFCLPGVQSAWNVLYSTLVQRDLSQAQRDTFFNVPAYVGQLTVGALGVADMGQPVIIYERSIQGTIKITSIAAGETADGIPYIDATLQSPHGITTPSQQVVVFRAAGAFGAGISELNGAYSAVPQGASVLRLMGCYLTASAIAGYTTNSAILSWSNESFPRVPMVQRDTPFNLIPTPQTFIGEWSWSRGQFLLRPAGVARQIRITYLIYDSIPDVWPATEPLPVDGSLDFLAHYAAAALLQPLVGSSELVQHLYTKATGTSNGIFDEPGGFLKALLAPAVKQSQMEEQIIMPRFRPKRNVGGLNPY